MAARPAPRAVVLVSGGLDSATTLALAHERGYQCFGLSVDYGQRHIAELDAARIVASRGGVRDHKLVRIDLGTIGGSALTDESIAVPSDGQTSGIPITYVPARNSIMLSVALGYAETLGARALFIGANAVDYSGYPDCRPEFIAAFETLANLATRAGVEGQKISVEAPLIALTKAEIIAEGVRLGVDYSRTVSCYQADAKGRACGECDSCRIRRAGFDDAGVPDPTRYVDASD